MGVYVYSIRTKATRALVNGEQRNVYPYKYSYKPYSGYRDSHGFRTENRLEGKAKTSLAKILRKEEPKRWIYVCFGDPLSVDAKVYRCRKDRLPATIYDDYFSMSQPVGYLYRYKLGKRKPWIVAMEQSILP